MGEKKVKGRRHSGSAKQQGRTGLHWPRPVADGWTRIDKSRYGVSDLGSRGGNLEKDAARVHDLELAILPREKGDEWMRG